MMSNKIIKIAVLIIVIVSFMGYAQTVQADYSIKEYKENMKEDVLKKFMTFYIMGVGNGYAWANTELEVSKRPLLYCVPKELSLNATNYISILDKQIERVEARTLSFDSKKERQEYLDVLRKLPIEYELLTGLQITFPCKEK